MHTVAMALLATCAVTGVLRWRPAAVARYLVVTLALTGTVLGGTRLLSEHVLARHAPDGDVLAAMRVDEPGEAVVLTSAAPVDTPPPAGARLRAIGERRTLRVAYLPDALPFAFFNGHDELVGFDVALIHHLAKELGVRLEFVPIAREALDRPEGADLLRDGYCDLVIGGLAVTTERADRMQLSSPYLEETVAFVVADRARHQFESWDAIRAAGALTIAVPDVPYYTAALHRRLPEAQLRRVATIDGMFTGAGAHADAMALPAERGSAWTLRYPEYSVVVPGPDLIKVPLAFALPRGESDLAAFVNTWIDLKRRGGTIDELYQRWILGRAAVPPRPRWSILRDVLHWAR
jgi:ABC-type amino acid transport substrate-binding protein